MTRYYQTKTQFPARRNYSIFKLKLEKTHKVAAQRAKARNARHVRRMQRI